MPIAFALSAGVLQRDTAPSEGKCFAAQGLNPRRCPSKLADNVWLLCGWSEKTRVHQLISALIKDDGELLVESNFNLAANMRDVDGLLLCTEDVQQISGSSKKGETCGFYVTWSRSNETEISHERRWRDLFSLHPS